MASLDLVSIQLRRHAIQSSLEQGRRLFQGVPSVTCNTSPTLPLASHRKQHGLNIETVQSIADDHWFAT